MGTNLHDKYSHQYLFEMYYIKTNLVVTVTHAQKCSKILLLRKSFAPNP